jgi:uncharacterized protein (UPF0335 family)
MTNPNETDGISSSRGLSEASTADLVSITARIESREKVKKEISGKISAIYKESKAGGYDIKALRSIIRLRKMKEGDRAEQEAVLDTYKQALGMLV